MKAKLMAVLLAVGLGVTGVAATAQAAEAGTQAASECEHSKKRYEFTNVKTVINWDGYRHYVEYEITYFCEDCLSDVVECEATYEPHDYEQIYYDDGRVLSYCTVCDDRYYW